MKEESDIRDLVSQLNLPRVTTSILVNHIVSKHPITSEPLVVLKSGLATLQRSIKLLEDFVKEDRVKISSDTRGFETWPAGIAASIGNIETWSAGVIDNIEFHDQQIKNFCKKNNICHICCHEASSSSVLKSHISKTHSISD